MNARKLLALTLIVGLLAPAAAAAPLAAPCVPGAAYNPACDANQDGSITVTDIQLTAGHWNQTGTFVSDSNHTHLGQTWTGASNPLKFQGAFGAPDYAPVVLSNTQGHGLSIPNASIDGIYVGTAGAYGMVVNDAAQDGVYVGTAGNPSTTYASTSDYNGFEVAGAEDYGLYIGRADQSGVLVNSAGGAGIYVGGAYQGMYVGTAGAGVAVTHATGVGFAVNIADQDGFTAGVVQRDGLKVQLSYGDGVDVQGNAYAGNFVGNINVSGNCIGCRQANFAINAGERALQPGDVVSVQAVTSTDFDTTPALWEVVPVQPGQTAVGVVAGRAELDTEEEHRPTETGKRLLPRDGPAEPGDFVTVVYSGPVQVKAAPGASAITAGTRLTAAADGRVRPLQTRTIEGMLVTEGAPVLGVALADAQDGLVWVLVGPR